MNNLTADERESYADNGYLVRAAQLTQVECQRLRQAACEVETTLQQPCAAATPYELDGNRFVDKFEATIQFEHRPGSPALRVVEPVHHLHPAFTELVHDPRIVAPMRDLVGAARVALWTDKLNFKPARSGSAFPWHQDSPYWMHDCDHVDQLVNVMVCIDAALPGTGRLRFLAGSHQRGMLRGCDDERQLAGFYTHPEEVNRYQEFAVTAPGGSLIFFSAHVVHGSRPNTAATDRKGVVLTYQPAGHRLLKQPRVVDARVPA